ncbi:hypothetical protein G4B88_022597 [Cannabis sativa]|uniref:Uncharacterized protein n=1 Tax=Cannabis sativa TaxID=3483 RepID=A0A7J6HW14_CANSA|nr:hypothetical protein G4B88_022597 [Cannabis sativa]
MIVCSVFFDWSPLKNLKKEERREKVLGQYGCPSIEAERRQFRSSALSVVSVIFYFLTLSC